MNKEKIRINVRRDEYYNDDSKFYIYSNEFGTFIPKNYLELNNLEVDDNKIYIDESLYNEWFHSNIQAKKEKQILFDSFYPKIPLFVKNKEMILNESRFYNIQTPEYFFGIAYCGSKKKTLGELLLLWENEKALVFNCKCGSKIVCFQFAGSPLNGMQSVGKTICLGCSNIDDRGAYGSTLQEKLKACYNYKPIQPVIENPATYEELFEACKNNLFINSFVFDN
jgi:hypothetical protein